YAGRDFKAAAAAFERAAALRPQEAIAYNNLADTLLQLGRLDAALAAARTAVRLGGPHAAAAAQTLREIEARLAMPSGRTPSPAPSAPPAAPREMRARPTASASVRCRS